jgi:hypothetical protein
MTMLPVRLLPLLVLGAIAIPHPRAHAAVIAVADEQTWRNDVGVSLQVDFEAFTGPVSTEYPGLVFAPFSDGSPASIAQYPYEGDNSMFTSQIESGGGGGWAADFDTPASGVAMWVGDVQFLGTTISFFDSAHENLGTFDLLESGSGNGPGLNGFNGYASDSPNIARIEITIDPSDAVWFDNVQFGAGSASSVPAPSAVRISWGQMKGLFR